MPNIFRTGRPTTSNLAHRRSTKTRNSYKPRDLKVKGQDRKVTWRVWQALADKSRKKHPRNTIIGGNVVHLTGNNAHQFQGQRSKVKVTRPTNAETGSAQYLSNGKAYEGQTWYTDCEHEDPHQEQTPWPSRSKVKVARSRDAFNRCWPISQKRNSATPKLVGRLSTPRAIIYKQPKVKLDYCWY